LLYPSITFFPFTGREDEHGAYNNVLNIRMKPRDSLKEYQPIFEQKVIPFLSDFNPDLIIVSAGYDANEADALGWINLKPEDYKLFTKLCLAVTRKIVFGLEGGYELQSLSQSVLETIEGCLVY
jgi:acetoin utilization deacetylase AcuC-like enzyme